MAIAVADDPSAWRVTAGRYEYVYRAEMPGAGSRDLAGKIGHIEIRYAKDQVLEHEERVVAAPGCGAFPALSVLAPPLDAKPLDEAPLVAFCGSDGGRHVTLKVFRATNLGHTSATLDFLDGPANLNWDRSVGNYIANTFRPRPEGAPYEAGLPILYRLHSDGATLSFVPTFGPAVASLYRRHFEATRIFMEQGHTEYLAPAVASLVATGSAEDLCDGLATLERAGFARQELMSMAAGLPELGYPALDTSDCPKGEK